MGFELEMKYNKKEKFVTNTTNVELCERHDLNEKQMKRRKIERYRCKRILSFRSSSSQRLRTNSQ